MGKNFGKRGQTSGRGRRAGPPKGQQRPNGTSGWKDINMADMGNADFEAYYKAQGIVPEGEWDAFMGSLRTELPTTFRVTGSRVHADTINDQIKDVYVPTMQDVEVDGVKYDPPKPIAFYPGGLAWEISAPKRVVRKQPAFKLFQRFLVGETEVGNLSRQEAVSMIPPLLMDVQPHHHCLDMCAAPGSKTAQIIEALNPHHTESSGLLIANDADYKRTHMLVHQTGRMPSKGLIVTNFDATMFPNVNMGDGETLKFDRILADVPCSGDGTLRKNMEIWNKWAPGDGNSLHVIQLRILDRAMNMLKPGGRLVYSTCSFNPSENEAVVAAGLNAHPGEFSIVDVAKELPGLKRHAGISSWKVATRGKDAEEMTYHESYDAYREAVDAGTEKEKEKGKGLPKTIWAPANAADLHLDRCLRLLPHDQNTGGFFVCVLQKAESTDAAAVEAAAKSNDVVNISELPEADDDIEVMDEKGALSLKRQLSPSAEDGPSDAKKPKPAPGKEKKGDLGFREDPFSFVDENHEEVGRIVHWFHLKDSFPRGNLLVRNAYGNPLRTVYVVNDTVKTVIQNNDYTRLRMISAGVKAFVRQDSQQRSEIKCKWRVSSDGILEILQHVPEDALVQATIEELYIFLEEMYPPIEKFSGKFKEHLVSAELGNMLVRFEAGEGQGGKLALPLFLPVWKAKHSMSLLIDKREKSVLSNRTFGKDICKPAPPPKSAVAAVAADAEGAETSGIDTPVTGAVTPAGDETRAEGTPVAEDEEAAMNA